MKTNQELLDFYGVELGKKYIVTKSHSHLVKQYEGCQFTVHEDKEYYDGFFVSFKNHIACEDANRRLSCLGQLDYEEVKPEILTDEEKEYLSAVIKPFRDSITTIAKNEFFDDLACIYIEYRRFDGEEDRTYMPMFNVKDLYLGMKSNKKYTLEELGL